MANAKIRSELDRSGMYEYELADLVGIDRAKFYRMMRRELPAYQQEVLARVARTMVPERRTNSDE